MPKTKTDIPYTIKFSLNIYIFVELKANLNPAPHPDMNPFLQIGSAILGIQIAATTIKFLFGLFAFDVPAPEGWIRICNFRMIGPRSGLNTKIRNPYKMYYSLYSLTKFFLTMLVASYKEKKKVTRGQDPDLIFLQGRIRIRLFLRSDPDFLEGRSRIRSSQSEFATIL